MKTATIQTVKQNMPFILWNVQYATYSMSVKTRHHAALIRLNNYRKDVKDPKTILGDKILQKVVIDLTKTQDS